MADQNWAPTWGEFIREFRTKEGFHKYMIGEFDYKRLCKPTLNPWRKQEEGDMRSMPFFGPEKKLPACLGAVMGLQHALSMMTGIIGGPLLIAGGGYPRDNPDSDLTTYIIATGLMTSGIFTTLHVFRLRCRCTKIQLGTGVISVMGTSTGNAPLLIRSIIMMMENNEDFSFEDAWGRILGTMALCSVLEIIFSFLPPKILMKLFPGWLCGIVTTTVAIYIFPFAIQDWGGGRGCARDYKGILPAPTISDCYKYDKKLQNFTSITCYDEPNMRYCPLNGQVRRQFGHPVYIAFGLITFLTIPVIELWGSPFLRSISLCGALAVGMFITMVTNIRGESFWRWGVIRRTPPITFFYQRTFPLGVYFPLVLPFMVIYITGCVDSISDITATEMVSGLPVEGEEHERTIQGGILADGIFSISSVLLTALPGTIYSSNNGIIALSKCASRVAGYWIGFWLFLGGLIGHFASLLANIPRCVLGAVNVFKFSFILVAGLKLLMSDGLPRRQRVIFGLAAGYGIGISCTPEFIDRLLWPLPDNASVMYEGLRDGIVNIINTPFTAAAVLAVIMNATFPPDAPWEADEDDIPLPEPIDEKEGKDVDDDVYAAPAKHIAGKV